jgi:glutamine synthetase type III
MMLLKYVNILIKNVKKVTATLGFLIDRDSRPDLAMTGRTLLAYRQRTTIDDHYFVLFLPYSLHERFRARMYVAWNTSKNTSQ